MLGSLALTNDRGLGFGGRTLLEEQIVTPWTQITAMRENVKVFMLTWTFLQPVWPFLESKLVENNFSPSY